MEGPFVPSYRALVDMSVGGTPTFTAQDACRYMLRLHATLRAMLPRLDHFDRERVLLLLPEPARIHGTPEPATWPT